MSNVEAFAELYSNHWNRMVALATQYTGRRAAAEDVVQDAFRKLLPRIGELHTPAAYLRVMVVNGCLDWRRRDAREQVELDRADPPVYYDAEPSNVPALLALLPPAMRTVVRLRYVEDRSEAETAAITGSSMGTVKSHAHHGLRRLRRELAGSAR